jgi:hypothetical protein
MADNREKRQRSKKVAEKKEITKKRGDISLSKAVEAARKRVSGDGRADKGEGAATLGSRAGIKRAECCFVTEFPFGHLSGRGRYFHDVSGALVNHFTEKVDQTFLLRSKGLFETSDGKQKGLDHTH